jgi:hypothetical protein
MQFAKSLRLKQLKKIVTCHRVTIASYWNRRLAESFSDSIYCLLLVTGVYK